MRKIYILISQTGTLFSRGLKWYTEQPYNHSAISTDKHFPVFWTFARKWSRLPVPGCFIKEEFNKGTYALFPNTDCIVIAFETDDEKAEIVDSILDEHINSKKKYGYNYLTILSTILLGKSIVSKSHRRTCMEFVAYVLSESMIHTFDKKLQMIHPMDVVKEFSQNTVYKGKMRDIKLGDFL